MVLFPTSSHASEKTIIATTVSRAPKDPWDPISMINSHIVALLQQLFLQTHQGPLRFQLYPIMSNMFQIGVLYLSLFVRMICVQIV